MISSQTHPTLQEVTLPQGTLRYRDLGRGPPLVFIHGLLVNGNLWRQVVSSLAPAYRCLIPDLPLGAHEVAMRPDADLSPPGLARLIADFLAALDLREVTLIANNTGGALTQLLLVHHPERVARVVLTNCDAFENFPPPPFRFLTWGARVPGFVELTALLLQVEGVRRLPFAYGRLSHWPVPRDVLAGYTRHLPRDGGLRRDLRKVLRGVSSRYTLDAARRLPLFRGEAVVVWGAQDRVFPLTDGRRLAGLLRAPLVELPDTLVFVPEDQPLRLAQTIQAFLDRTV